MSMVGSQNPPKYSLLEDTGHLGLGLKMKRKQTETCFIVFVFLYLVGIKNGIRNPGNEYENGNHRI
jgi:hypothetical protein